MSRSEIIADKHVIFAIKDCIATITLNRPECGNALDLTTLHQLLTVARDCEHDPSIRCVILTGSGRMFCSGGDIRAFAAAPGGPSRFLGEVTSVLNAIIATFIRMPRPLVVAVNGPAAGAGLGLALLGDLVIAARSAHFSVASSGIGLTPDGGITWLLPRLIGLKRTQELVFSNRRLPCSEAHSIGLISRVVDDFVLNDEAEAAARSLRDGPALAHVAARQLLMSSFDVGLETQLGFEAQAIAIAAASAEGKEGIAAFLEKRGPNFCAASAS